MKAIISATDDSNVYTLDCEINAIELAKALSANTGRRALTLKGITVYPLLAFMNLTQYQEG